MYEANDVRWAHNHSYRELFCFVLFNITLHLILLPNVISTFIIMIDWIFLAIPATVHAKLSEKI